MYQRLSESEKKELRHKYERCQEYMVSFNAVDAVSEHYADLSPEEIWSEALEVVEEISNASFREWKVETVYHQLKRKYSSFRTEDGSIENRTPEQQEKTALMVLFDVVLMLTLAQKTDNESVENHPYFSFIRTILSYVGHTVLFESMLAVMKEDEEKVEAMTGKELEETDYMEGTPEMAQTGEQKDLSDNGVRIPKLKKLKTALYKQEGLNFKGGSQWFYVYKLMAENHTYEDRSYALFESDLKAIRETVNTDTFSRKYDQIKNGTTYPNWKAAPGKKQSTLTNGIEIAKMAFSVLYM